MSQFFRIHPHNPQMRLVYQVVDLIKQGGVVVLPSDGTYLFCCEMNQKSTIDRLRTLRRLKEDAHLTLLCRNLHDIGYFAQLDNQIFRAIKELVPGPYVFLLPASSHASRRFTHAKSKSIALRVPDHPIIQSVLAVLDGPLLSTPLLMPGQLTPLNDPEEIYDLFKKSVDLVVDGGIGELEGPFLLDCRDGLPEEYYDVENLSKVYL